LEARIEATDQPTDFAHIIPILWGEQPMVDARALHGALGVGRDFSNWIKDRLDFCDAVEGVGYEVGFGQLASETTEAKDPRGHNRTDYRLTVPLAKEIAMLERNDTGKAVRRYFLEVEARYISSQQSGLHYAQHASLALSTNSRTAANQHLANSRGTAQTQERYSQTAV
jgi:anti-repressor protein